MTHVNACHAAIHWQRGNVIVVPLLKIILGTFLIGKIRAAALRQEKDKRVRHFLIVDEAVDFMHYGMSFPKLFSQARKHKLSLVLASQHVTQIL